MFKEKTTAGLIHSSPAKVVNIALHIFSKGSRSFLSKEVHKAFAPILIHECSFKAINIFVLNKHPQTLLTAGMGNWRPKFWYWDSAFFITPEEQRANKHRRECTIVC